MSLTGSGLASVERALGWRLVRGLWGGVCREGFGLAFVETKAMGAVGWEVTVRCGRSAAVVPVWWCGGVVVARVDESPAEPPMLGHHVVARHV